jgi:hypothetical protein
MIAAWGAKWIPQSLSMMSYFDEISEMMEMVSIWHLALRMLRCAALVAAWGGNLGDKHHF